MPLDQAIWKVGKSPKKLPETRLTSEHQLEDMIVEDPGILSEDWMLIGRQVATAFGKYVDLLAIDEGGNLIIIELKKSKTPREVVVQAIDYASWVEGLGTDEIAEIYGDSSFSNGNTVNQAFQGRFNRPIDEDVLNQGHQIVIVASELDPSTERIVNYLSERDIPINVLFFRIFEDGYNQYLSRTWLIDPSETQDKAATRISEPREPWNGEFYVSFGVGPDRNWEDARKYGFVAAGGGEWYSRTLSLLNKGDRIWVNVPKKGYVGVGTVKSSAIRASECELEVDGQKAPFNELSKNGHYNLENDDDEARSEYIVPIDWIKTVPLDQAISEIGFFGNQNSVCKPTTTKWGRTVKRLKERLEVSTAMQDRSRPLLTL